MERMEVVRDYGANSPSIYVYDSITMTYFMWKHIFSLDPC
jgi:hypothetical protein